MSYETRYITTVLNVFSCQDLSELAAFFQEHTCILHCGWQDEALFHLCLEPQNKAVSTVDMDLDSLLSAAEKLPDELKSLWYSACEVDFNLGIETDDCHGFNIKVATNLLQHIAQLNGTLSVTTYPAEQRTLSL